MKISQFSYGIQDCNSNIQAYFDPLSKYIDNCPIPCINIHDADFKSINFPIASASVIKRQKGIVEPRCFIKVWPQSYKFANNFKRAVYDGFYENYPYLLYCIVDDHGDFRGYIMSFFERKKRKIGLKREPNGFGDLRYSHSNSQIKEFKKVINFLTESFQRTHLIYLDISANNLMWDKNDELTVVDLEIVVHPEELLQKKRSLIKRLYLRLPLDYRESIEAEYPELKQL